MDQVCVAVVDWALVSCYPFFFSSAVLSSGYPHVLRLLWSVPPVILSVFSVFVGSLCVSIHLPSLWHLLNGGTCFSTFLPPFPASLSAMFYLSVSAIRFQVVSLCAAECTTMTQFPLNIQKVCILGVLNQFAKNSAPELLICFPIGDLLHHFCLCINLHLLLH